MLYTRHVMRNAIGGRRRDLGCVMTPVSFELTERSAGMGHGSANAVTLIRPVPSGARPRVYSAVSQNGEFRMV